MPDVSIFNIAGTARSQAASALSTAQGAESTADSAKSTATTATAAQSKAEAAQTTATQALKLAQSIEDLTRVEVSYENASETIKITNGTHEAEGV